MSSVTFFEFNEIYKHRDSGLTDEERSMAIEWATNEVDRAVNEWSKHTSAMWKIDPEWETRPFYEHMSHYHKDDLEQYFWGLSLIECCPRHMGDSPVAIGTEETTPIAADDELCYCCKGERRHRLRMLQRAYKLALEEEFSEEDDLEQPGWC